MAILVTGGAGYIGSHCCIILKEKGFDVVAVDNLSKGHAASIDGINLYIGNIGDCLLMDRIFSENNIDGVMHFAAYSLVGESMEKPYEYYRNNVAESLSLFNSMIKHNVKYVVFSSTAATYGQPDISPITENSLQNPINTYGETKLAIEKMLKWFDVAYGLKNVCLRYFNVAGAHVSGTIGEAHIPETHLIPIILEVANGKREKLNIYGNDYETPDGTCVRDYIHVCDLIDAHIKAYEYMKNTDKSDYFNLGSGGGYSNLEILNTARAVTGHAIPAEFSARRPGDPPELIASSEKAVDILNWNRKYGIRDIISTAWKWHGSHPDGYGNNQV
ncbi:MAG: UDP-glucose 4-epimerase GalE [Eubacteriales bacterium]|nr:UDP-glucose 4-epimerase GalE [Eubacteriales bacterium]